jgi:hypothetical protein
MRLPAYSALMGTFVNVKDDVSVPKMTHPQTFFDLSIEMYIVGLFNASVKIAIKMPGK